MYFKTISVERTEQNEISQDQLPKNATLNYSTFIWLKIEFEDASIKKFKLSGELMTFRKDFFVMKKITENLFEFYDEDCKIIYRHLINSKRNHALKLKLLINYIYFMRSENLLKDHYLTNIKQ